MRPPALQVALLALQRRQQQRLLLVVDHAARVQLLDEVLLLAQHRHRGAVRLDRLEARGRLDLAVDDEFPHLLPLHFGLHMQNFKLKFSVMTDQRRDGHR